MVNRSGYEVLTDGVKMGPPNLEVGQPSLFDDQTENGLGDINQTVNTTNTTCSNEYCVSDDDYVDMIKHFIVPTHFEWFVIGIYFIVFLVGVIGNFLVCFAVWKNQYMRTVTNYFIVNLAIADLMVVLICLPSTVLVDVTETWFMGRIMCKMVHYTQGVSVSVSVMTLSFISVERWYAICHPLSAKGTTTRTKPLIIIIWLIALLLLLPDLVVLDMHPRYPELTILLSSCKPTWPYISQTTYEIFKMVALYFLPLILMAFMYGQIVKCLWSNFVPTESCNRDASAENQILARRKAAKMLIAVVIMFGVCYLPVHLLNILRYFKVLPDVPRIVYFAQLAHWFCYFNSAVNPVIYNFMSARFQKEFKNACSCCSWICWPEPQTRRAHGDSMYSYKYTNDMSQTEQIQLTTINDKPPASYV